MLYLIPLHHGMETLDTDPPLGSAGAPAVPFSGMDSGEWDFATQEI